MRDPGPLHAAPTDATRFAPIAIVGQACLLPGADSPEALWRAVLSGQDLTAEVPEARWGLPPASVWRPGASALPDRTSSTRGGYVSGFEALWDATGFAVPEQQLEGLDPLVLWSLHCARAALRSAGIALAPNRSARQRRGAVLGNLGFPSEGMARFADRVWAGQWPAPDGERAEVDPRNRAMAGGTAALLSQALALDLECFCLDAACASSLYAIKLACDRLNDGEADVMLAGAVQRADDLFLHMGFTALSALSPSGQSRPFHADADGLLPAEGCAFVVLKRLQDARRDGDAILAVIRGVGLANDGRGKGLLVPDEAGQVRAMQAAWQRSGLDPAQAGLLECHATGTQIGDATELRSMRSVFGASADLPIASLKGNLGHLITVAGLAALIKLIAALQARVRPPNRPVATLSAGVHAPFRVLQEAEPWPAPAAGGPRIAALSAFGFGGNNAHLVLSEHAPSIAADPSLARAVPDRDRGPQAVAMAVVGIGAMVGACTDPAEVSRAWFAADGSAARARVGARMREISLPMAGLRFPPVDLAQALPQQLAMLSVAQAALSQCPSLAGDHCTVLVGMEPDAEVARHGTRWRRPLDAEQRDRVVPALSAAAVLGCMPNIPANRLSVQFDLRGPAYTIQAGADSGLQALRIALRDLQCGEVNAALVGAVDLTHEVVTSAANAALRGNAAPIDAAVALLLKRLPDAERDGDTILACFVPSVPGTQDGQSVSGPESGRESGSESGCETGAGMDPGMLGSLLATLLGDSASADATGAVSPGEDAGCEQRPDACAGAAHGLLAVLAGVLATQHRKPLIGIDARSREADRRHAGGMSALEGFRLVPAPAHAHQQLRLRSPAQQLCLYAARNRSELIDVLRSQAPGLSWQTAETLDRAVAPVRLALLGSAEALPPLRARALARLEREEANVPETLPPLAGGIYLSTRPISGELAFVFAGAGAAHADMGRSLLQAWPELALDLDSKGPILAGGLAHYWQRVAAQNSAGSPGEPDALAQLLGASALSQLHAHVTLDALGLAPDAWIGLSSGESNALVAAGVWRDPDALLSAMRGSGLMDQRLGGSFESVAEYWSGTTPSAATPVDWAQWTVLAPLDEIRSALHGLARVHIAIIHSEHEALIAGEASACLSAVARLGASRCVRLPYALAVHVPEFAPTAALWHSLHYRRCYGPRSGRVYSSAWARAYTPTSARCADALLAQAESTLDMRAVITRAWRDGVRIFVEHGPGQGIARAIRAVLGGPSDATAQELLVLSLDRKSSDSEAGLGGLLHTAAALWSAGQPLRWAALAEAFAPMRSEPARCLRFPAHWPPVQLPTSGDLSPVVGEHDHITPPVALQTPGDGYLPKPPALPPVLVHSPGLRPFSQAADDQPSPLRLAGAASEQRSAAAIHGLQESASAAIMDSPRIGQHVALARGLPALAEHQHPSSVLPGPVSLSQQQAALATLAHWQKQYSEQQRRFLRRQSELQQQFLQLRQQSMVTLLGAMHVAAATPSRAGAAESATDFASALAHETATRAVQPQDEPSDTNAVANPSNRPMPVAAKALAAPVLSPQATTPGAPESSKPTLEHGLPPPQGQGFDRAALETHASGQISSIFGPLFEGQDQYQRQVRMPEPPLLLADRVIGLTGAPASMGRGCIWTETDVARHSWCLHQERLPAGVMIEAGQADLMLISWLGVDAFNRGERVYRLLGCELTYHGDLPHRGDVLRFRIELDGHAAQGDVRLMFFHYDCTARSAQDDGEARPQLSVRNGQAGFFTEAELAASAGCLWDPLQQRIVDQARLDPASEPCRKSALSKADLQAWASGDAAQCFGIGFERARCHTRTPTIHAGRMLLLDRVSELALNGGPWRRGYLRAELDISPDQWFFAGHFKNDPCMPGTLMFEACLQAMAIYLAAHGYTLDRDGWRFQPLPELAYALQCRGQVTPRSRLLVTEVFVEERHAGPQPTVFADLLCTVDGLKAFHARRVALTLVPDWPLDDPQSVPPEHGWESAESQALAPVVTTSAFGPNRVHAQQNVPLSAFRFDRRSLLACAMGRPSEAFGPMYRRFDAGERVARLPSPPYHFISRIREVQGAIGEMRAGARVVAEYDIPGELTVAGGRPRDWYQDANSDPSMPFAVLLEAALQPCGWLSSYVGSTLTCASELGFRNLDGEGVVLRGLPPGTGTLVTEVLLSDVSASGGMIIESFDVRCHIGGQDVYRLRTVFGFFPPEALAAQAGLPVNAAQRDALQRAAPAGTHELESGTQAGAERLRLPRGMLRMIDAIEGYWPQGGAAGRGQVRAIKHVDPGEWFFKAHFFQDPVQPGSLGLEAMLQTLQWFLLQQPEVQAMRAPRFESIAPDVQHRWKYRGQVLPRHRCMHTTLELSEHGFEREPGGATDPSRYLARGNASLWVDGKRIYEAFDLAVRVRDLAYASTQQGQSLE